MKSYAFIFSYKRIQNQVSRFILVLLCCGLAIHGYAQNEICDNAIDDDQDGFIDFNDPDCVCEIINPISLIPNPSFEEMNCCPSDKSQLYCANDWIQASEPTTDYLHTCNWIGWDDFIPPFPFPDGFGAMGFRDGRITNSGGVERNWKEYAGACLINPLVKDSSYRFEFDLGFVNPQKSPPINVTFFGTTDCSNLPFGVGNIDFGCPTNGPGWIELGSKLIDGGSGNQWVHSFIEVTPTEDIKAIAIGPECAAVLSPISIYYFFDNLVLADLNFFDLRISEFNHPCQDNFTLQVPNNETFQYQWYKDGIALVGETIHQLSTNYGDGEYTVSIDNGVTCRVSGNYSHQIPIIDDVMTQTICENESFQFGNQELTETGVYEETFTSFRNCDSIVTLNLEVLGTLSDTTYVQIFKGETYNYNGRNYNQEGTFEVIVESILACDSLVLLHLEFFEVYIPNVFSPDGNGINDVFEMASSPFIIQEVELNIFDRWGAFIFSGEKWNGKYNGDYANPGPYVYVFKVTMVDGIQRQFAGSVTVVR